MTMETKSKQGIDTKDAIEQTLDSMQALVNKQLKLLKNDADRVPYSRANNSLAKTRRLWNELKAGPINVAAGTGVLHLADTMAEIVKALGIDNLQENEATKIQEELFTKVGILFAIVKSVHKAKGDSRYYTLEGYNKKFKDHFAINRAHLAATLLAFGEENHRHNSIYLNIWSMAQVASGSICTPDYNRALARKSDSKNDNKESSLELKPEPLKWEQRQEILQHGGRIAMVLPSLYNNTTFNRLLELDNYPAEKTLGSLVDDGNRTQFAFTKLILGQLSQGSTHYIQKTPRAVAKRRELFAEGKAHFQPRLLLQPLLHLLGMLKTQKEVHLGLNFSGWGENPKEPDGSTGYLNATLKWDPNDRFSSSLMVGDEGCRPGKTNPYNGHTHSLKADSSVLSPSRSFKYNNPVYRLMAKIAGYALPDKYNGVIFSPSPEDLQLFYYHREMMQKLISTAKKAGEPEQQQAKIVDYLKRLPQLFQFYLFKAHIDELEKTNQELTEIKGVMKNQWDALLTNPSLADNLSFAKFLDNNNIKNTIEHVINENFTNFHYQQLRWIIQNTTENGWQVPPDIQKAFELRSFAEKLMVATRLSGLALASQPLIAMQKRCEELISNWESAVKGGYSDAARTAFNKSYHDLLLAINKWETSAKSAKVPWQGQFFKDKKRVENAGFILEKLKELGKPFPKSIDSTEAPSDNLENSTSSLSY